MLDIYNERPADIVLTPTEDYQQQPAQEDNDTSVFPSVFRGMWPTVPVFLYPLSI